MIYLSDNGKVLGEFEESAVAEMLATDKISSGALFLREGMGEWRPLAELNVSPTAKMSSPGPASVVTAALTKAAPVVPADPVMDAAGQPEPFPAKFSPLSLAGGETTDAQKATPLPATSDLAPAPHGNGKSRHWLAWSALALLLFAGAGGGAWWWINREPPVIPGTVALSGTETSPVEIRVFRRADLAAPWRERLAAADARGIELGNLLAEASKLAREKSLLYEEASKVFEVGEEYNMPDLAELRAERDAKQAEAESAKADHDKLQAEKDSLLSLTGLLDNLPPPIRTVAADAEGKFALPPEEGEVALLATATTGNGEGRKVSAWLEIVKTADNRTGPEAVRFSEGNRLDLSGIRNFADAASP